MDTFYLQRAKPFQGPQPEETCVSVKQWTRHLLAAAAKRHPFAGQYDKFIDTKLHAGHEAMAEIQADSWLAAKLALGYPLTTRQSEILLSVQKAKVLAARKAA